MFGIDVSSGSAALTPIDLDGHGGEGATAIGNPLGSNSNSSAPSVAGNSNIGKHKPLVWADFDEIYETVNGRKICTKATCKMCKSTLSARSRGAAGTSRGVICNYNLYLFSVRLKTFEHV